MIQEVCSNNKLLNVYELNLHNCAISSLSLVHISLSDYAKYLENLNLSDTNVDDEGLKALCSTDKLP